MPKLPSIERAKQELEEDLRQFCAVSQSEPRLIPSLRELAEKFGLSKSLAQRVVRSLCDEGILYPVHGMGTFAGRCPVQVGSVFLFLTMESTRDEMVRQGFEERLSDLGAAAMSIGIEEAKRQLARGSLPPIQAIWDPTDNQMFAEQLKVPVVGVLGHIDPNKGDSVAFDDFQGGVTAARHLFGFGLRRTIFLGVHGSPETTEALKWSSDRADGFLAAMKSIGLEKNADVILPPHQLKAAFQGDPYDYFGMGWSLFDKSLYANGPFGVVAANDRVAYGFLAASIQAGISPDRIPAIVGFDSSPCRVGAILSSMSLQWSELGRAAADVLFRRVRQTEFNPFTTIRVPMAQVTRLSSRPGWLVRSSELISALEKAESEFDLA